MSDTFTIGGVPIDLNAESADPLRYSERFSQIPSLTIQKRGVALPGTDPWVGQEITWTQDGTLRFVGDIVSVEPSFANVGWVLTYQCLGLRNRLDWFPHTDSNTGIDTSPYNLQPENPLYNLARTGRTVGEIIADVLVMLANAQTCAAYGIGNYTGLPLAPVLPSVTVADLAAMTVIPPHEVYVSGEKFGCALDGFLQQCAPNYRMWIDPDGNFRFRDIRTFPATTFTMGFDPVEPSELSRDIGDCFQRVVVRGQPIAVLAVLKLSDGDIVENFSHDGLTNDQAKAAWTPADFQQPGTAQDVGTCLCTTTTTINVTSSSGATHWVADFWDQSHQQGWINLSSSTIPDYTQYWSARIVACTALSAGGTSTITIDTPMPSTQYDKYTITGLATGGSVVWTQYQIANTTLWPRVVGQTTSPQPLVSPGGGSVSLTSSPVGIIIWSLNGGPPYNTFPAWFTFNATTGNVRFAAPTYLIANNAPPADVWVAIPIQTNPNVAVEPPDVGGTPQYAGTSHTVDGLTKTLTITQDDWRDPGSITQIQTYASDVLDSIKDAICEGSITYYGLYTPALTFGMSANVAGADGGVLTYPTGWESLALPVIGVDLVWTQEEGMLYKTVLHCSNRKDHYSADMFMHPQRIGGAIGTGEGGDVFNPFGVRQPDTSHGDYAATVAQKTPQGLSVGVATGDRNGFGRGRADTQGGESKQGDQGLSQGMAQGGPLGNGSGPLGLPGSFADLGIPTSMADLGIPTSLEDLGIPTDPGQYMQQMGMDPASWGLDFGPSSYGGVSGGRGKQPKGKASAEGKAGDQAKPAAEAKLAGQAKAGEKPKQGEQAKSEPAKKKPRGLQASPAYAERQAAMEKQRADANKASMEAGQKRLAAQKEQSETDEGRAGSAADQVHANPEDRDATIKEGPAFIGRRYSGPLTPRQIELMDRGVAIKKWEKADQERQEQQEDDRKQLMATQGPKSPAGKQKAAEQQARQDRAINQQKNLQQQRYDAVKARTDSDEPTPEQQEARQKKYQDMRLKENFGIENYRSEPDT